MSHDHAAAKQFRDVVASIARAEIEKMFPPDRYAQVRGIREAERRVVVQYNGESEDNLVSVPYNSVKPAYVGQWVRIGGSPGDRHVIDTLGGSAAEERAEEVLSQAPVFPKWMQADPRMIDAYPMGVQEPADNSLLLRAGRIGGTVIRIPTDMSINRMCFRIKDGRSGNVRGLLYRMMPSFDAHLLAQTGTVSAASESSPVMDLDSELTLERGDEVFVAAHNLTSGDVTFYGRLHRVVPTLKPGDALTFHLDGHSSAPESIFNAQWSGRNDDRSWGFSLIQADPD